jgi:hypothetical protein
MSFFRRISTAGQAATAITSFQVDGELLPVQVRENARAKRFTLRLSKTGEGLTITVPPGAPRAPVEGFLERHRGWVAAQRTKRPAQSQPHDGCLIPIRGELHRIVHQTGRGTTHTRPALSEQASTLHVFGDPAHLVRRVADFLKRQARDDLDILSRAHAATLGTRPSRIVMRDTTSRWGSCSSTGTLSYSWRIIMAPPEVIDYLAAHEVSHLREMNHSPLFWALVEQLCPDYNNHRQWLRAHGQTLHAWQFG